MLRTIDRNDESRISAQEIDFHSAPAVERNGKVGVHLKSSARLLQRFQPSIPDPKIDRPDVVSAEHSQRQNP